MEYKGFGYYFEKLGRSGYEGPNDPSIEHFSDKDLEESVVREMIQNSLDAYADPDEPVTVVFDLREINTKDIPGVENLRPAAIAAIDASHGQEGLRSLEDALRSLNSERVWALRIGDYGTLGLRGSESRNHPTSSLSALTRAVGVSLNAGATGARGGSYGIGSSVGLLASRMRVVSYASRAADKASEVVYSSHCRLAGFRDQDDVWRKASGYFTSLAEDDFVYLRDPEALGPFPVREELGTDVYVHDFAGDCSDSELLKLRRAIIRNFFVAIHKGKLIVCGGVNGRFWQLDQESLEGYILNDCVLAADTLPFYVALTNEQPVTRELPTVGTVKLFINMDSRLPKKLHTQAMRRPLMKIQEFKHNTIHYPYAAIFICDDPDGDKLLRSIEPTSHLQWNTDGSKSNKKAVEEIKAFIREELRKRAPSHNEETVSIRGLERLLPKHSSTAGVVDQGGNSSSGEFDDDESPVQLGVDSEFAHFARSGADRTSATVWRSGVADETSSNIGQRGNRGGRKRKRKVDPRPNIESPVEPGDGRSRIRSGDVDLRSFFTSEGIARLILTALRDVEGDLDLVALGPRERDKFGIAITQAKLLLPDGAVSLPVEGSILKGLKVATGEKATIEVELGNKTRYRLGVGDA